jgi:hypothetical protein
VWEVLPGVVASEVDFVDGTGAESSVIFDVRRLSLSPSESVSEPFVETLAVESETEVESDWLRTCGRML